MLPGREDDMAFNNNNQRGFQQGGGYNSAPASKPITAKKVPALYVDQAEKIMNSLAELQSQDTRTKVITSTKIRKLFGLFTDLYNEIKRDDTEELNARQLQSLTTARVRLVYECGRGGFGSDVTQFVQKAELLEYLKGIGSSRSEFLRFHQYFEALVAYHRYYFGDK